MYPGATPITAPLSRATSCAAVAIWRARFPMPSLYVLRFTRIRGGVIVSHSSCMRCLPPVPFNLSLPGLFIL